MPENIPTTVGGFAMLASVYVLLYLIKARNDKPREEEKIGNLKSQSSSLVDQNNILREMLEAQKKYSKFGRKQSKKINRKLGFIHEDVIIVKQQTGKKKEN